MSPRRLLLASAVLSRALGAEPDPAASIVRIAMPPEADERRPLAVPTEPANTIEVEFPWAVADWAGRGFTPDPDRFAGDFVIQAARGSPRIFVTPVAADAHRVLHVVLAQPSGHLRSVPIEFIPAPADLAWRKVVLENAQVAPDPGPGVSLEAGPPPTHLRDPSPESELGLITTLRLMVALPEGGSRAVGAANPALEVATFDGPPRSFGDFTIRLRLAVRDSATDTLGLCASVANATARRLLFDPDSWVVRAGNRVYPLRTVDFAGELDPGAVGTAFLVLARGPDGEPTRLLPANEFELSVRMSGSVNPRPVSRLALEGFDPR